MTSNLPVPTEVHDGAGSEASLRRDLAAAYSLAALFGWDDTIFTHFSVRLPQEEGEERFLINPYGLLFEEIRASDLIVVDVRGQVVRGDAAYNPAGFTIHSAVHMGRADAHCVMHTHTLAGMAMAACAQGLRHINQISTEFYGRVGQHAYEGVSLDLVERSRIQQALGAHNVGLLLQNHGLLTVGESVADAFYAMFYLNRSAEIQLAAAQMTAVSGPVLPIADDLCVHARAQLDSMQSDRALIWNAWLRKLHRVDPSFRD